MATTTAADPPEASAPRIVVQDPPPAADGLEDPAASSTTTLEPPLQQPNMGLSAGATTFLVLLLATLYLAWDARRRRRQRRGGQEDAGLDRMHPARRERLEAEERERRRKAEQEARQLAALRAKRFGPADSGQPGAPAIPDADLLAGRQPFPFEALPATTTLQVAAEAEPTSTSSTVPDPASYMVCTPLDTVEELWAWTPAPGCLAPKAFILPYQPPPHAVQHEALRGGQLLVCHDMKGGYHLDRYCFGPSCAWADEGGDGVAFRLYQWDLIDALIYFTHRFITVPPPGWTALCHRHGVKALGTFITEWEAGREKCRRVFESQETVERCVEQMVAIAVHHGFEGWLINIENPIDWEGGTGLIVTFLELITRRMREVLPAADPDGPSPALVLWYDSVTHDTGELKWQDALNERNEAFFRACDGIFTNYCWKQEEPARSAARADAAEGGASSRSRRWDVFMGIDCFGRNTYGGGGFDCDVALRAIRQAGVSAALFAPGWVWEDQVEGARRRARGEGKEEAAAAAAAAEEQEGEAVQEAAKSKAAVVAAVEKEEWGWRRVEGEFEATQERFWAKIGAMWPRRPLPADLSEPFLSNFGTGVGLHVWDGGVRLTPAFTPANASTGGDFAPGPGTTSSGSHVKPFYNLAMQDALPLALTHCSRACIKQAPTAPTKAPPGGGRVSGRIGHEDDSAAASAQASSCPPGLGASTSYRTAYRGGSSLCVSGLLQPGAGATRATLPLYQLDAPTSGMALEVRVVYKAPHSTREDDFCLELVLQGEGASTASSGSVEAQAPAETVGAMGRLRAVFDATTTTTHVILRPPAEEKDAEGGGGNSSGSWGSRRVGKVLETRKGSRRTRKVFYAPVLDSPPAEAEATKPIMTSEQALAATVAQARAQAHASAPSLESVYDEAALEALPWRQRVFRVRDLALEGARIKELRLVCLKKSLQSNGGSDGLPLPYCLFLGELSVGHVRKPPPFGATTPRPGPTSLLLNPVDGTPALRCARLELHLAHWDPTARRLSGQLAWEWEGGDDDAAYRRLLADTDVLLFCPGLCTPVWVGRAFAPAFALSVALPEGDYESVRLVLQPRDRLGSVLPICSCPSLAVEVKA